MKMITRTVSHAQSKALLQKDTATFRGHISRIAALFREQVPQRESSAKSCTCIWVLPMIIDADRKMISSLLIGHQLRLLSILS